MPILQYMRPLTFLIILLLSMFASGCRSSQQSAASSQEIIDVAVEQKSSKVEEVDILSILSSSLDIDIEGLTIEFYAPDSLHPNARAAPKTLKVDKASAKAKEEAVEHTAASTSESDSLDIAAKRKKAEASNSRSDVKVNNPIPWDWITIILILAAAICFYLKFKK